MAGRRRQRAPCGAALLLFLVVLVVGTLTFVVGALSPALLDAWRAQRTAQALAEARTALLWYAATFREQQNRIQIEAGNPPPNFVAGYLPLPDLGSGNNTNIGCPWEGCDANLSGSALNKTVIGRLPWFILGTGPLRDGHGECLWYAVSGGHQRVEKAVPMNWDTLGQIDIVTASDVDPAKLKFLLASPHERPTAVIFSPGIPLGGQNRADLGGNDVRICGGNYDPANYIEPNLAAALLDNADVPTGASAYFAGSVATDTSTTRLALATQGRLYRDGTALEPACPPNRPACAPVATDTGLAAPPDALFGAIRKNAYFRQDINSLLDRIVGCLRDEFQAPGPNSYARIAGVINNACYGQSVPPINYYPHYQEQLFVARATATVNGLPGCNGALLFASQRGAGQVRETPGDRNHWANYLEDVNLANFAPGGAQFSGPEPFERVSPRQAAERDIVRCIPATPSLVTVGPAVAGLGPLAVYSPATRTLTLGRPVAAALPASAAASLFGCAWMPETHPMGAGLRSYFMFRIDDAGFSAAPAEGIAFVIADGDNNGADACGAAGQHLGYSGNNTSTPFIVPPKIAFEIDPRRNADFDPNLPDTLSNGRNDPPTTATTYRGGHVALSYWGGDAPIPTSATPPCVAPRFASGGLCYLPQEEDDNVHGPRGNVRADYPAPPVNPPVPGLPLSVPPDAPAGAYKLDPQRSQVPVNQNFHVRVELTRTPPLALLSTARVATTGAIDIAHPGTAIDGVILFVGDRILVKDQVSAAENGLYVWNGATRPLARAADADSSQALGGSVVEVAQGTTNARSLWRQAAPAPAPGTDPILWSNLRVKVAVAQADIGLASPGAAIDGILMKPGDRVLVRNLGIYVWNGASVPMTPAPDNFSGTMVQVQQGSAASGWWRFDGSHWTRETDPAAWPAIDGSPSYTLEVWILPDSVTTANQIAAMQDTTRPMSFLAPAFTPHLRDTPVIPYPFRNVRLGFTVGQRRSVTDQNFTVSNAFTTWIP